MLTDKTIKAAISAVATELTLNDGATNGRGSGSLVLVVRRLATGAVSAQWFAKWKRDGQRQKKALGRYPDIPLLLARQMMAAELAPLIRAGKSPVQAPSLAGRPTVERMFQGYVASMKDKGRASATEVERVLLLAKDNAADALGRHRLASEVEADDVVVFVSAFYRRGHRGAADKARSYIASAFAWAMKSANDYTSDHRQEWGIKHNPAADVPKDTGAITTRDRNLAAAELAALWHAAGGPGFGLETGACIRLLIACGQRVQETLRLEGKELDLDAGTWTMPAHKTKGRKRPHTIPLPSQVLPVLRQLVEVHGDGPLFPARTGAQSEQICHRSIKQAIDRWLARQDVTVAPFQSRDLRRTWKSRAGDAGVDRFTRDLVQQHARHDTGSKAYDRTDYFQQMRDGMQKWDTWLAAALEEHEKLHTKLAA